ncbi:hypothetical protein [Pajaroellobacter abortibovis]|uniref:Uncharacterized protein n=1 Tax=Pajaroellobacter abortibovis TaxID=1882918 RepID=A0A1L6MXR7_9BACT|nr:hypothetical protein [Pajaroellobacter abortibovis]APS00391.1 hypothetical protein BCY86_06645 [Pajaroellobacter abortibovis]
MKKGQFDLIVLDPPVYLTTKKERLSATQDSKVSCFSCSVGGRGLTAGMSSPLHYLLPSSSAFLHQALHLAGRKATQLKALPLPFDYPVAVDSELTFESVFASFADSSKSSDTV